MITRWPTYFIPHGGGPCFFMDTPPGIPTDTWDSMAAFLRGIDGELGQRPKAVLVISAHWETNTPTLLTSERPALLYDYYGFPPHTYELTYPAHTPMALAGRVKGLLERAGMDVAEDTTRGLDHGVFIPFKLIYPDADVPVLQLSQFRSRDAAEHIRLGEALAPLRDEGVLIIGSGLSYHNLRQFFAPQGGEASEAFDDWLTETALDTQNRDARLSQWNRAPGAMTSHPTPEHLLPMMVAAGAAKGDVGVQVYSDHVLGKAVSGYRFGDIH